jgi:hypothetical protein
MITKASLGLIEEVLQKETLTIFERDAMATGAGKGKYC